MAESKNNVLTHGLTGLVGDMIVFRNRGGRTFVSTKPRESKAEPTEAQKEQRGRFQQAILYGRGAIADPTQKSAYEAATSGGQTAYNVAVADFFHAPDIQSVDAGNYTGKPGDKITVRVTDDFMVAEVTVTIYNADGTVVESGAAAQTPNSLDWEYTAQATNASLAGDRIVVRASDLPGNRNEQTESL